MNIGIDATALYGHYGGVEYALWNLLAALNVVDGENNYTVYIPQDGPPPQQLSVFNARWNWMRLPFAGNDKARRVAWQQTQLPKLLKRDRYDLLHAPTYVSPIAAPVPVVLTVYDIIALTHPQFATPLNRVHYRVMLPLSLQSAQRIIVPSEKVRAQIARRLPTVAPRTSVIPLGLEPAFSAEHDADRRAQVRALYGLPDKFILFVGNFEPKKNLRNLLLALRELPDAPPLVLAGGSRAWTTYESRHELPETSALRTLSIGYVRRGDLPVLYSLCEAFAFPSLAEGFGLPVLEALASGAVVVTSREVALPNLANVALLCDPRSPHDIALKLRCALNESQLRDELQKRARHYARPFTWRRAALQTLEVYRQALQAR